MKTIFLIAGIWLALVSLAAADGFVGGAGWVPNVNDYIWVNSDSIDITDPRYRWNSAHLFGWDSIAYIVRQNHPGNDWLRAYVTTDGGDSWTINPIGREGTTAMTGGFHNLYVFSNDTAYAVVGRGNSTLQSIRPIYNGVLADSQRVTGTVLPGTGGAKTNLMRSGDSMFVAACSTANKYYVYASDRAWGAAQVWTKIDSTDDSDFENYGWRTTITYKSTPGLLWFKPDTDSTGIWWDPATGFRRLSADPPFGHDYADSRIAHIKDSFFVSVHQPVWAAPGSSLKISFWHLSGAGAAPDTLIIDTTLTLEDSTSMRNQSGNYHSQPHIVVRDSSLHIFYLLWFDRESGTSDSCALVTRQLCWRNGVAYPDAGGRDTVYIFSDDYPKWGLTGPNVGLSNGDSTKAWIFIHKDVGIYDTVMISLRVDLPDPPYDCGLPAWGACCLLTGECIDSLTEDSCLNLSGIWSDTEAVCDTIVCDSFAACCDSLGVCDTLTIYGCDSIGGDWAGAPYFCDSIVCPLPQGACCFVDSTCHVVTQDSCTAVGGDWQGNFTTCTPDPCPQPLPAGVRRLLAFRKNRNGK